MSSARASGASSPKVWSIARAARALILSSFGRGPSASENRAFVRSGAGVVVAMMTAAANPIASASHVIL